MQKESFSSKKLIRKVAVNLLAITSLLAASTFLVIDEILIFIFGDTTLYSRNYSDQAFTNLEIGSSQENAITFLGPPLESYLVDDDSTEIEIWVYSKSNSDSHFRKKLIHFKSGIMVKKIDEVVID
ncbi:hypothetical protein O5O45_19245 [Hahella aquimaris]|uniref:hypothetical protein n=1 Tax=Hahella sp. HNIBRBA332 TaxID=3015983 RepID=UPI00273AE96E|nr:hypothetical protein [Hahella sp. HNIBRBA332]WLQ11868.1 hypothetical protein O5O45_19245 [Hahella sp. HNIBRBA332]